MQLRAARRPYDSRTRHGYILAENLMFHQLLELVVESDVGEGAVIKVNFAVACVEKCVLMVQNE